MKKYYVFCLVGVCLFGCGKNDYPAEVVMNFMNSCITSGGGEEFCSCAIDKLQKEYTIDEYLKLESRILIGDQESANEIADVTAACRK